MLGWLFIGLGIYSGMSVVVFFMTGLAIHGNSADHYLTRAKWAVGWLPILILILWREWQKKRKGL